MDPNNIYAAFYLVAAIVGGIIVLGLIVFGAVAIKTRRAAKRSMPKYISENSEISRDFQSQYYRKK